MTIPAVRVFRGRKISPARKQSLRLLRQSLRSFLAMTLCPFMLGTVYLLLYLSITGWIWQDSVAGKDKQARKLYNEDKIDEALSKWRDAQTKNPDKKELHYNIGNALHKQNKYEDAFNEYAKSTDTKNTDLQAKTYYNIGNTHYKMGKLEEAIKDYEKCLEITPDDEDARYNIEFIKKKLEEQKKQQEGNDKEEKQEKQEQQPKESEGQKDKGEQQQQQDTGNKEQDKKEEKQPESGQEDKQQEQQESGEQGQTSRGEKSDDKDMSKEDAIRLLDALKNDEKDLQRDLRVQSGDAAYNVEKDW